MGSIDALLKKFEERVQTKRKQSSPSFPMPPSKHRKRHRSQIKKPPKKYEKPNARGKPMCAALQRYLLPYLIDKYLQDDYGNFDDPLAGFDPTLHLGENLRSILEHAVSTGEGSQEEFGGHISLNNGVGVFDMDEREWLDAARDDLANSLCDDANDRHLDIDYIEEELLNSEVKNGIIDLKHVNPILDYIADRYERNKEVDYNDLTQIIRHPSQGKLIIEEAISNVF